MKPCFALTTACLTTACLTALAVNATDTTNNWIDKAPAAAVLPGKGPVQDGDWFDQNWRARRTTFRQRAVSDRSALVFLGDSITQGWSDDFGNHFPKYRGANRGIGGDTTRGVLFRLQEDVLDLKPAAIVLLIGTNDLGIGGDPADTADNTRAILAAIRQLDANAPVIICKVMPRADGAMTNALVKIQKLNRRVDEIVKADAKCLRCDTWSIFGDHGTATSAEFYDYCI